jgi:hypothetical protein
VPTFSQNPHIDYWPVGASLQPNNEFVNGSTANYFVGSGTTNSTSVLSSTLAERAPGAITAGSGLMTTTFTASGVGSTKISSGSSANFTSTDRVFVEAWVKVTNISGTVTSPTMNAVFVMYNSSSLYVGAGLSAAVPLGVGSWTRIWATMTGAQLIAIQATATKVGVEVRIDTSSASAGAQLTWAVGKMNYFVTPAVTTRLDMVAGGSLISQGMPYTSAESTATLEMREAIDLGAGGGPISVA